MENKCYLLSVKELCEENGEERLTRAVFAKVDKGRREKAVCMRPGAGRAASLGAGLLLQLAVQEVLGKGSRRKESEDEEAGAKGSLDGRREPVNGIELVDGRIEPRNRIEPVDGRIEPVDGRTEPVVKGKGLVDREKQGRGAEGKLTVYTVSQVLKMLEEPLDLKLGYGRNGKPYLQDYPFYFNLSHSGEYVFCAISDREVGVDIQQYRPADEARLARRFFSEEERKALEGCLDREEQRELFYRLWVRKEAYGKLTGEGIAASVGRSVLPVDELQAWDMGLYTQQQGEETVMPETPGEVSFFWQEWGLCDYRVALCQYKE